MIPVHVNLAIARGRRVIVPVNPAETAGAVDRGAIVPTVRPARPVGGQRRDRPLLLRNRRPTSTGRLFRMKWFLRP